MVTQLGYAGFAVHLFLDEARNCYERERPRPDVPAFVGLQDSPPASDSARGGSRAPIPERERFSRARLATVLCDAIRCARTLVCH